MGWVLCFVLGMSGAAQAAEEAGRWTYKAGVEERVRYEQKYDFDFNDGRKDNGGAFFHRLRLDLKSVLKDEDGDKLEIFVQGLDAQTGGYRIKPVAAQKDDFDFHQGYIRWNRILGSDFGLKLGRQEAEYGKGRLIGAPAWSNRMRTFDAAIFNYENAGWKGDAIYLQDMKYDDNNFNDSSPQEFLAGVYGGYQKDKASFLTEGYFLTQRITSGTSDVERHTFGPRLQGKLGRLLDFDIEAPYQFGSTGGKDIRAYALAVVLSRGFDKTAWKSKVNFEYNQASGDRDPGDDVSGTFNPLYQSTHTAYGLLDFFRWQNMREAALGVTVSPTAKLKLTPQTNFFWLESTSDAWVNSSGTVLRSKTSGERGHYVGQEVSLRAAYAWNSHVQWETGYAHFFTADYVGDTGSNDDTDWIYTQVNLKY